MPKTLQEKLDEMVRDFTSVIPKAKSEVRRRIDTYAEETVKEVLEGVIEAHNARILNEFQSQMKPDMPMIIYDERIALIPAIEIATKETVALLQLDKSNK